jgi:flavin-dependent dehydrogenase
MEEYDVIIVGAGPAGGGCARELSKLGHSVLLLERSKVIGEPNFSTAGTPNETMEVFDLPKKVTDSPWSSLLIASKNKRAEFVYDKRMGYVLNYKLLKQFLAEESEKNGTDVITGANATDVLMKNNFVNGVKFVHDGEEKEAHANIVIDSSGGRCILSQKLGIVKLESRNDLAVGIEYHMENVERISILAQVTYLTDTLGFFQVEKLLQKLVWEFLCHQK